MKLFAVLFAFLAACPASGEITHVLRIFDDVVDGYDEVGTYRVSEDSEGYTNIASTDDGYLIEIFTKSYSDRVGLLTGFGSDNDEAWYRFTWDRLEHNGVSTWIRFDPWHTFRGFYPAGDPKTFVFQPESHRAIVFTNDCPPCRPIPSEGAKIVFEYSVEEIDPPLPADFNYDNFVGFADFLILAENFEVEAFAEKHYLGDANLDGSTDFEDFLILSDSFGTSREVQQAASVPEPSIEVLSTLALSFVVAMRSRRY